MLNLFGVVVFHRSMVNWRRTLVYLLYVKPSVVVFSRSMVDWRGLCLTLVYVHSAICETYKV